MNSLYWFLAAMTLMCSDVYKLFFFVAYTHLYYISLYKHWVWILFLFAIPDLKIQDLNLVIFWVHCDFLLFSLLFFVQDLELRTLCLPCRCFCCWTKTRPHFDIEIWQFTTVNISVRLLYLCSIFSLSLLHSLMIAEVNFFFNFISTHSLFWGVLFNFTVSA